MSRNQTTERKRHHAGHFRSTVKEEDATLRRERTEMEANYGGTDEMVRWGRVQALRLMISSGTYRVSVEQVADSLMRFAKGYERLGAEIHLV